MACAWITHGDCRRHEMGSHHPECPERLDSIADHLMAQGLMSLLIPYEAPAATPEQLERAHTARHVMEILAAAPSHGYLQVDPDTAMNRHSLSAALHAAGAVVLATDLVMKGDVQRAFCAVRPPGHHATRDAAMGFCLFNNAAVGVMHALDAHGLERVALIDFDVHHGNGSEDILADDQRVLMASTFQRSIYPFSGDNPLGPNMVNIGLPAGSDGKALREAVETHWLPALNDFRPQLLFISAGFDAHRADELASLRWVEDDYAWVTERLIEVANDHGSGRIVSTLEGGYDLQALARSVGVHVRALVAH